MKFLFTCLLLLTVAIGCKPKILKGKDLENKLVETMNNYLNNTPNSNATFKVKNVIFYPDARKKLYNCQFNVTMHIGNKDTSGIVAATITNDFQKVVRSQ
jgi:hypothetical protein